ncbi:MAG: prepilin-type N-terminal cleavage/methylation domain-containing protein [Phycisphaerales bacterium]|nr:prepilin-type N-terminal cleavage/methylation domain-containing protein [Phycisphaerales bacterium]
MNIRPNNPVPGFTLVELLLALAISAVVMSSVPMMISLSSRATPTDGGIQTTAAEAADCFAQLTADLQLAMAVTELTANSITMTVPSRDGSGVAQTIRYAWGGTPGDPVTIALDGVEGVLVTAAADFTLGAVSGVHSVVTEQTLVSASAVGIQAATSSSGAAKIPFGGGFLQAVATPADADVLGWAVTEVVVGLKCAGASAGESVGVSLVAITGAGVPTGVVYATTQLDSTAISSAITDYAFQMPPLWLPRNERLGVLVTISSTAIKNTSVGHATSTGETMYYSADGLSWAAHAQAMQHKVVGTILRSTGGAADRTCLERLDVSLTTGDGAWVYATSVTPLNMVRMP